MEKIESYIVDFDKVLLDSIILNREKRYNDIFYHQQTLVTDVNESTPERHPDASISFAQVSKITKSKKKENNKNNLSQITAKAAGYDSDEERENAHSMFIEDIQTLRS